MVNIAGWNIDTAPTGFRVIKAENEIIIEEDGQKVVEVRTTPRGLLAIEAVECTFYIDSNSKTITFGPLKTL